jgi:hypothetical protein
MVAATLVVLGVLLLALLIMFALLGTVALRRRRERAVAAPEPPRPALGSTARVLLDRGERAGQRLDQLGAEQPLIAGVGDDASAVVAELRAAAGQVAALDQARANLATPTLQAQQRRLDEAIAAAAGSPAQADLVAARDSVAARLATAARHQAARDALLARMRAAVTGLEQAETELTALLATAQTGTQTDVPGEPNPAGEATTALQDRLAGLRAGLAEVRAIGTLGVYSTDPAQTDPAQTDPAQTDPAQVADQGLPGDLPGSVEPPPRT